MPLKGNRYVYVCRDAPCIAAIGGARCLLRFPLLEARDFSCVRLHDGHIYVGDWTKFGPNVTIATAGHPLEPDQRMDPNLQYNKDVRIGSNVWIGAGALILPGVSIGDNTVIGAGSVVTKDIPANVVAYGNPCRAAKELDA